jgi:hypothetical protein
MWRVVGPRGEGPRLYVGSPQLCSANNLLRRAFVVRGDSCQGLGLCSDGQMWLGDLSLGWRCTIGVGTWIDGCMFELGCTIVGATSCGGAFVVGGGGGWVADPLGSLDRD